MASYYPFREYCKDLILWSADADVPVHQQRPLAVLQLAGTARSLADEIDVTELMNGVTAGWGEGMGIALHPGLHALIRRLGTRYREL